MFILEREREREFSDGFFFLGNGKGEKKIKQVISMECFFISQEVSPLQFA